MNDSKDSPETIIANGTKDTPDTLPLLLIENVVLFPMAAMPIRLSSVSRETLSAAHGVQ